MEYKSGRLGPEERRQNVNYEELYGALAPLEKKLKDLAAGLQKSAKAIAKNTERGDLKSLAKELAACQEILKEEETIRNQIEELVEGFDAKEYFDSGDYAGQLMELCREQNVDITGSYPVFVPLPGKVRCGESRHLHEPEKGPVHASFKSGPDRKGQPGAADESQL